MFHVNFTKRNPHVVGAAMPAMLNDSMKRTTQREMMKKVRILRLCFACIVPVVSACSGGSSSDIGAANAPKLPSYETVSSANDKTSTIGGVALRQNQKTEVFSIRRTNGSLTHRTGATVISDFAYTLTDPNGLDSSQSLTDGKSILTVLPTKGRYDYVRLYEQDYTSEGTAFESLGIFGVQTRPRDIPVSGRATYQGEAFGFVKVGEKEYLLKNGSSTVLADFGTKSVDVKMTGFTALDSVTENVTSGPIDSISVTGMKISDNRFADGDVSTSLNGVPVNIAGPSGESFSQGAFYGYDSSILAPDEVGGIALLKGGRGIVMGTFLAD